MNARFVIGRLDEDGLWEGWETQTRGPEMGTTRTYGSVSEARDQLAYGGGSAEFWRIFELREVR